MIDRTAPYDVAIIGAGMAGITCARELQQVGYRVVVLEKSRGVGGRMATRRLHGTIADHGAIYLTPKGDRLGALVERLIAADVLQVWTDQVHTLEFGGQLSATLPTDRIPRYVAEKGMTAIAKFLATDLDLRLNQRVESLDWDGQHWQVAISPPTDGAPSQALWAKAVVMAIPAPQAVVLLQPLASCLPKDFMARLTAVEFVPCLSAIAGYPIQRHQDWSSQYPDVCSLTLSEGDRIAWIGLDSSKRLESAQPVFVIQSTATFAAGYLDAPDRQSAGTDLLKAAAQQVAPWLETPDWLQVHRWRYAFAQTPLSESYLTASPLPLLCTGDWCGGMKVENAFLSGLAAASQIQSHIIF